MRVADLKLLDLDFLSVLVAGFDIPCFVEAACAVVLRLSLFISTDCWVEWSVLVVDLVVLDLVVVLDVVRVVVDEIWLLLVAENRKE